MSEVTKLLPVTVRFDGCFCSEECEHWCYECYLDLATDTPPLGHPKNDLMDGPIVKIPQSQDYAYIRTRWCCRTFGMGPFEVTKEVYNIKLGMHPITYKMDSNLCAPDCPELVDGMCFRNYPEDWPILQKSGDRYERDESCVDDFGMGDED